MITWNGHRGETPTGWGVVLTSGEGWGQPFDTVNFYLPGSRCHIPDRSFDVEPGSLEEVKNDAEDLAEELDI